MHRDLFDFAAQPVWSPVVEFWRACQQTFSNPQKEKNKKAKYSPFEKNYKTATTRYEIKPES